MIKYPMKLNYVAKTAIWGGNTLKDEWGKECEFQKLAETWELSVRENAVSTIENGEHQGLPLSEYLQNTPDAIAENSTEDGRFPLLIKLIDAADKLSIQVHPDDEYAKAQHDLGKNEMWYIVAAAPDAEIVYGLTDYMTESDFRAMTLAGQVNKALKTVPVHAGECYFIPAGLVHAIGKGCLIAEIQQNSDITYRVYDYDRRDAEGNLRELHVQKALDVVRAFSEQELHALRFSRFPKLSCGECLAACEYFEVHLLSLGGYSEVLCADGESFHSLLCIGGEGSVIFGGIHYPLSRGDSYFLPAGMGNYTLCGNAKILLSRI